MNDTLTNTVTITAIVITALVAWAFGSVLFNGKQATRKALVLALAILMTESIALILD